MLSCLCFCYGIYVKGVGDEQLAMTGADSEYKLAKETFDSGELSRAAQLCRAGIAKMDKLGRSSPREHMLLGRIYLLNGDGEKSADAVSEGWRPGRDGVQDLLVAIAGSRSKKRSHQIWARTALNAFLHDDNRVTALVGSAAFLPPYSTQLPASIESSALILMASQPDIPAWEALKYASEAKSTAHGFPIIDYVLGKAYSRLGQSSKAKECLENADKGSSPKLHELIKVALKENDKLLVKGN